MNRSPLDGDATPPTVRTTPDTAATVVPADIVAIAGATAELAAGEWPLAHPCVTSLPYCYSVMLIITIVYLTRDYYF